MEKMLHYFWFGHNEKPELVRKCIASWKQKMPDWQIIEWNETNYNVNCIPYSKEAYEAHKYAFVSDYARCKVLYEQGGVYLDTDVEILRSLDDLVENNDGFMGFELDESVAPGLIMGAIKGEPILREICEQYEKTHFLLAAGKRNMKTIVEYTTEILIQHGLVLNGQKQKIGCFTIFPREYFAPFDVYTEQLVITDNTYSIHHYTATWQPWHKRVKGGIKSWVKHTIGPKWTRQFIDKKKSMKKGR